MTDFVTPDGRPGTGPVGRGAGERSLHQFRASYVPPSRFYGGPWWRYLIPRRLTLRAPGRLRVYRWLVWNYSIGSGT